MNVILSFAKKYKKECITGPVFKLLEAIFELIVPLVIASIIDVGIKNNDYNFIIHRVLLLAIFSIIGYICAITAQYFAASASVGISSDIRDSLFRHIQRIPLSEFEKTGSSTIVTGITGDINQIASGINLVLRLLLRSPFIVFGATIMAFSVDKKMSIIFFISVIILGLLIAINMKLSVPIYTSARKKLDVLVRSTDDGISGVRIIRGFCRASDEANSFKKTDEELNYFQKKAGTIAALLNPSTFLVVNIALCMIIWFGGVKINVGTLTQGETVALYNYMSQILVELIKLANLIIQVSRAVACSERVSSLFELKVDEDGVNDLTSEMGDLVPDITVNDVSFTYSGNSEPSLVDLSVKIKHGQRLGIIGKTGSGKSTFASLLMKLYTPDRGTIQIDGIDYDKYGAIRIKKTISLCLQKADFFTGSIRDNLKMGREEITDENIVEALKISCAYDFVNKLPGSLDYELNFHAANLSGGQRQRLGIARALLNKPKVIIFDDSSSALDAQTEATLYHNLSNLDYDPTLIIISQKIKSVESCEKILVLDDGNLISSGTHEQLLHDSEIYRELFLSQTEKSEVSL